MKLHLAGTDAVYSIEQIALTLFPERAPRYSSEPDSAGDRSVTTLLPGKVETRLRLDGREVVSSFPLAPDPAKHEISYAVRTSFYQAALAFLPEKPLWGSLSGVRPAKACLAAAEGGLDQAVSFLISRYDVSPEKARIAAESALVALDIRRGLREKDASLYINVPFCPSKCRYCSFITRAGADPETLDRYVSALLQELELLRAGEDFRLVSCYVGGGTPAMLSPRQTERLLSAVRDLPSSPSPEITVELGRPELIDREKLDVLASLGVGKISVNPQSLDDRVLATAGRGHGTEDFLCAYSLARRYPFSINCDLIALLEGETSSGFLSGLEKLLALSPDAVSVHSLAVKRASALERAGGRGEVSKTVGRAAELLRAEGYEPYYLYRQKNTADGSENVGWAKPGHVSLYNVVMMEEIGTVYALGAGGVSKIFRDGEMIRRQNSKDPAEYVLRVAERAKKERKDHA
ncbi:MAG: coproporphyrinogen dehydrogenase HemZ [Clostridia bacterium]|nr:coproporphyrinogen dehydrogenase HemZ [Clostridia bacterium]